MTKRAFTLIELLVVLAIISLLIAILLPALRHAKEAGRNVRCLANQREIGTAFILYDMDYGAFPWNEEEYNDGQGAVYTAVRFGWGGVNWYNNETPEDMQLGLYVKDRVMNTYMGRDENNQAIDRAFHCPSDFGIRQPGAAEWGESENPWEHLGLDNDGGYTVYAVTGNSYECNRVGLYGIDGSPYYIEGGYGMKDVHVDMSTFVLAGDAGCMRVARNGIYQDVVVQGWWHGFGEGNMTFADGSARHMKVISPVDEDGMSLPTTHNGYTFHREPK